MVWDHEVRGSSPRTPTIHPSVMVQHPCGSNSVGRQPYFQAGCRGFESRLPLFAHICLSPSASQASSEELAGNRREERPFCVWKKAYNDILPTYLVESLSSFMRHILPRWRGHPVSFLPCFSGPVPST